MTENDAQKKLEVIDAIFNVEPRHKDVDAAIENCVFSVDTARDCVATLEAVIVSFSQANDDCDDWNVFDHPSLAFMDLVVAVLGGAIRMNEQVEKILEISEPISRLNDIIYNKKDENDGE